ncbi:MAG TPA: hypothetical protein IGS53_02025 [Leptolyngbyaceae cyanobacterium M33_DOE_097]|uniref:Uncharacterized protein n=1 Tax=Oscillatoriales cyanobacterium SpSt-418 TaxID=2282169 RepID=A0A7C3PHR8_9CYAN|nr:hypothetical protein [Leptolyngbyaceae cyanobacterium M33_DOE_097]
MSELNATDFSLLSWVQQAGVSAHAFSVRFCPGSLVVNCYTLEDAVKLWESRSLLQISGMELCFQVNGTFYVGAVVS